MARAIAEQLDRRLDSLERTMAVGFAELRQVIDATNRRIDRG